MGGRNTVESRAVVKRPWVVGRKAELDPSRARSPSPNPLSPSPSPSRPGLGGRGCRVTLSFGPPNCILASLSRLPSPTPSRAWVGKGFRPLPPVSPCPLLSRFQILTPLIPPVALSCRPFCCIFPESLFAALRVLAIRGFCGVFEFAVERSLERGGAGRQTRVASLWG